MSPPPPSSLRARSGRRHCVAPVALALAAAWLAAAPADAQLAAPSLRAPAVAPAADGRDSARIVAHARRAQAAFERRRRELLPESWAGGGRCDVRIGRFCYWYDERAPAGPTEPPRVAAERARLLTVLDDGRSALPADGWLIGQQLRYRLEHGAPDSALAALASCAAADGWCDALRGLAHHARGDAGSAAAAFAAARAAMPEAERCGWTDIALLLEGDEREAYAALPCAARDSAASRYWWLATPFFARGANDRRNEHEARLVLSRLLASGRTPYAEGWRDDLHELVVRYGWPERWSRRPAPLSQPGLASVVGHDPSPAWPFASTAAARADPWAATADDWPLGAPMAVERYAPPFARRLHALPAAASVLRRGDSLLVVATYRAPHGFAHAGPARELVLALVREDEPPRFTRDTLAAGRGALLAPAPDRPHLLSLELLGDSAHAARARFAVRPPPLDGGFGVSDLLLFRGTAGTDSASDSHADAALDAALAGTVGADEVAAPGRLGVYWELYGLPPGVQAVATSLHVVGEDPGWLGRAWDRLRRLPPRAPVRLRWTDLATGGDGYAARAVTVELPALPPGRYRLELRVAVDDGARAATASRTVTVLRER